MAKVIICKDYEEASDKANYFASTNKGNTAQETAACIEADSVVREDYSAQDEAVSNDSFNA